MSYNQSTSGMDLSQLVHDDGSLDQAHLGNYLLDESSMASIIDLQKDWQESLRLSREKLFVQMTEILHQQFLADQQKMRTDLISDFRDELNTMNLEKNAEFRERTRIERAKVTERHAREIAQAKKKQWCKMCENNAIYACCWNTSYCSVDCQKEHWSDHRKNCRRNKNIPGPGVVMTANKK